MKTTTKEQVPEVNHAERNAAEWLETIKAQISALGELEAGAESVTVEGDTFTEVDDLRERIQESPLEVSARSGWHTPGQEKPENEEFLVLLTTGGPALRIIGELDRYNAPENPRLEFSDWGTPWTRLATTEDEDTALLAYCNQFYFGD